MTKYILSIDPGKSTGVALISYDVTSVPELVRSWQFGDGAEGLDEWLQEYWIDGGWDCYNDEPQLAGLYGFKIGAPGAVTREDSTVFNPDWTDDDPEDDFEILAPANLTVIAEKFNARNTGGFSYTTASLEPLRCEGVLVAHDLPDEYVQPAQQYIAGGKGKAERKKRQHALLRDTGFYRTGKDLDAPDADDFRSACAHALSWLMRTGHKPTYDLVAGWNERNA